jgi:hypothetical protein
VPDSFTSALSRLDPASRALLDLSLRRGMRTEEIAEVLGADPDSVAASRDEALRRVAVDVGLGEENLDEVRAQLAELPAEEWLGGTAAPTADPEAEPRVADPSAEEPAVVEPEAEPAPEPAAERTASRTAPITAGARRRRPVWPALLGLLLLAGVIAAIALAAGGDDEESTGGGGDTQAQTGESGGGGGGGDGGGSTPPPEPEGHEGGPRFEPIGAGQAEGRARLTDGGERIEVQLRDLPSPPNGGHFEVWLYSSLIESRSLGRSRDPVVRVEAKLPPDWQDYKFVDVSLEPSDGNAGHSGESVARLRVKQLAAE